jgi:ferric-dicitrate binding protein FerR (iron transport regulator)
MKKKYTTVEEISACESFQDYCMGKDNNAIKSWNRYIKKNPDQIELIKEAREMLCLFNPKIKQQAFPQEPRRKGVSVWVVASLLLILASLTAFAFYLQLQSKTPKQELKVEFADTNKNLILPDSSSLFLRKGAEISWKEPWTNHSKREVWLKGEAFFNVENSPFTGDEKFTAFTNHGSITVLGTSFLVKTDKFETAVILEEGKIQYITEDASYTLKPGDILNHNAKSIAINHNEPVSSYSIWKQKKLSFKNISIGEIVKQLNNSYPINVTIGNKGLSTKKITASISNNNPELLLQAIAEIYEIELIKSEDKFVLK